MIKLKNILSEAKIKTIDIWFEDSRGRFYKVKINGGRAPREWDGWSNAEESLSKLLGWEIHLRSMDDNKLEKILKDDRLKYIKTLVLSYFGKEQFKVYKNKC